MDDSVTPPKSEFLKTLISRGYMHQATNLDGLDRLAEQQPISAYIGFDCTANSCLLYTSPSPRDRTRSRMPSSA